MAAKAPRIGSPGPALPFTPIFNFGWPPRGLDLSAAASALASDLLQRKQPRVGAAARVVSLACAFVVIVLLSVISSDVTWRGWGGGSSGSSGSVGRGSMGAASLRELGGGDGGAKLAKRADEIHDLWGKHVASPSAAAESVGANSQPVPRAFHLSDCPMWQDVYRREHWDTRGPDGADPPWSLIKDPRENASTDPLSYALRVIPEFNDTKGWWPTEGPLTDPMLEGPFPPWVSGSDEDNYPMTRRVQRDIWLHQHPANCSRHTTRFIYMGFFSRNRHGIGAQLNFIAGAFALAMREGRVLVIADFDRANHSGCHGPDGSDHRGKWSCYFLPETSDECRREVEAILSEAKPVAGQGSIPPVKRSAKPMDLFFPTLPRLWGQPWLRIPAVVEANHRYVRINRMENKYRWWRAQVYRYLMRGQSMRTCLAVNRMRHAAFGRMAAFEAAMAELAIAKVKEKWAADGVDTSGLRTEPAAMESVVWARYERPWVPRPMVAMHVRMGDKGQEMRVAGLSEYLALLARVRQRDPAAAHVWLSTEMEEVVQAAEKFKGWTWFYSNIRRIGRGENISMPQYEASIGLEAGVDHSWANLFLSLEADYFIGALGSAWSFLVDAMRCTGGKMNNGFLSVNISPRW